MTARAVCGGRRMDAGFTLIELLVVIAILGLLAALILPIVSRAREAGRVARCTAQMRQLATAVSLYADSRDDQFPRSQHSAATYREKTWGRALAPLLGSTDEAWTQLLRGVYHCPTDGRRADWSRGSPPTGASAVAPTA